MVQQRAGSVVPGSLAESQACSKTTTSTSTPAIHVKYFAMTASEPLRGVEAYVFDIFGTVVDWYGSVSEALADFAGPGSEEGM